MSSAPTHPEEVFAALADPTRLRILFLVRDMELAMGEIADVLGQSQPRVSRHVRILAEAGLVARHKEGAWVFVGPADSFPQQELNQLLDRLLNGADPIVAERARLTQVRAERQRAVDQWFEANAAEWDLMLRLEGHGGALAQALVSAVRTGRPGPGRLLDIGTGTGRMLEMLGQGATSATGIDRSPEMLRIARAKLSDGPLAHAEIRQADMQALPFDNGQFDTVIMHQVLHFADDPPGVVAEAVRVLAPDGRLYLVDHAPHGHEELRTRFHHRRLGFEDLAICGWMEAAGLSSAVIGKEEGPELTSILWEGRRT